MRIGMNWKSPRGGIDGREDDQHRENSPGWLKYRWLGALVIVLAALVFGAGSLLYPLSPDQGAFAYTGHVLLSGGIPYKDAWDVKPPGIFFAYALSEWLLGKNMMAIRVLDLIWQALTALVVNSIARRVWSQPSAGLIAALAYLFGYFSLEHRDTANADSMLALPLALSILLTLQAARRRGTLPLFLAGACSALAFLFKYPLGILLPVLMLAVALPAEGGFEQPRTQSLRPSLVRSGAVLCGFVVVLAGCFLFFCLRGGWRELVDVQLHWAIMRVGKTERRFSLLGLLAASHDFMPGRWFGILVVVSLAVLLWLLLRREFSVKTGLVAAWLGGGLVSLFLQAGFFPYHYAPLLAPMAVLASLAFHSLYQTRYLARESLPVILSGLLLLALFPPACQPYVTSFRSLVEVLSGQKSLAAHYADYEKGRLSAGASMEVASFLRENTVATDKVYVWGWAPLIYFLAERQPVSRFILTYALSANPTPEYKRELYEKLRADPPKFFIIQDISGSIAEFEKFDELRTLVNDRYVFDRDIQNFRIFKRKS